MVRAGAAPIDTAMLKIALQKSGRLSDDSLTLIQECGISIARSGGKLKSSAVNFPLDVLFLRDDDIPECIVDGAADCGIIGENLLLEREHTIEIAERLGFSRCRLSIAVPKDSSYDGAQWLAGKSIATSYPNSLRRFLTERRIDASVRVITGSTEIAPGIGLADAICDLVSSGSTLLSNGLREAETVFRSEAVFVRGAGLSQEKLAIFDALLFRMRAVLRAREFKYILLNAPDERLPEIIQVLPGLKSPTIMPLAEKGWKSVHTVIREDAFWEIIERLKRAGAQGILVCPIEKLID